MNALAVSDNFTTSQVTDWLSNHVREAIENRKLSFKEAAREIGCSARTVENYVQGRCGISLKYLREMSRAWPELRPSIRAFLHLEVEIDAETERLLALLQAHTQRRTA